MARYTLKELEELTQAELVGDPSYVISGVETLEEASLEDASFLSNPRYEDSMKRSKAGVFCIASKTPLLEGRNYLIAKDPSLLFQKLVNLFHPDSKPATGFQGIHPQAVVHPTAIIEDGVCIGPFCVIDQYVHIQKETILFPHVYVGSYAKIGKSCILHPMSSVRERCILKDRVILQQGSVIGSCGFGYTTNERGEYIKLEQAGNVILEEDVEIGANTTIDRARFKSTLIKKGTKIDNLVQIAHNVEVGTNTVMAAQTGIAGSTKIGSSVMIGGQAGILGHIEITDQVMIATRSGVSKSLKKPGQYRGSPAIPLSEYHKREVHIRKLGRLYKQLREQKEEII